MPVLNIKKTLISAKNSFNLKDFILLLLSLLMGIYFKWNVFEVSVFLIFIFAILRPFPSRCAAFPAIFLLVLTPFFLIFKKNILAEQLAIYAYYFLVMAVILSIYEMRKDKSKNFKPN